MHISLTPELTAKRKDKVDSGLYNNASEVVRDALRKTLAVGEEQCSDGRAVDFNMDSIIKDAKAERGV